MRVGGGGVQRGKQLQRGVGGVVGSRVEHGAVYRGVVVMGVIVVRVAIPSPGLWLWLMSGWFRSGMCLMLVDSMDLPRIRRL